MGPQNGILGNLSDGFDLPGMDVPEQDLTAEKSAAKFSRTKEFQNLKEYLDGRIEYYRQFMPNGEPIVGTTIPLAELGMRWQISNSIIAELKAIIGSYEQAREIVKNASRPQD